MANANKVDERMFLSRNYDSIGNDNYVKRDVEVYGTANFVGQWENDVYQFHIWEVGHDLPLGSKKRLLFTWKEFSEENPQKFEQSQKAFHHGGYIPEEFVYCACLILRRRFEVGGFQRENGKPKMAITDRQWVNRPLVEGQTNLGDIGSWIEIIIALPEKLHQRVVLALKFYWQSLNIIEESPDLAYLNLISAIEILCFDFEIERPDVDDFHPSLGKILDKLDNQDLRKEIEAAVIKREHFISRKFVSFIAAHLNDEFWNREGRPKYWLIEPDEIQGILKRIYNQRSKTLHTGAPFPWTAFRSVTNGELIGKEGVGSGNKKWGPNEVLPTVGFFEELVNHVIKNYITSNSLYSAREGGLDEQNCP